MEARFKAEVWRQAVMPLGDLSPAVASHLLGRLGGEPAEAIRIAASAEDILVVVAGGVGIKAAYVPTWGGSTRAVSRRVR